MSKIKLTDIQTICEADGWKVVSDTYNNLKTIM